MIKFKAFQERHVPLFRFWLHQDHVKKFWQESENEAELKEKMMVRLSQMSVQSFIIDKDSVEIGYIQYYEAQKIGGKWWPDEKPGTFGIDIVIGSHSHVGLGLGPTVLKEFITFSKEKEPHANALIIDPSPDNERAIKAFEKAGFQKENHISTPGGPAVLMRMKI